MDAKNPTGINGGFTMAPGYGEVSKLAGLTAEAPLPSKAAPSSTVAPPSLQFSHQPPSPSPEVMVALQWAKIAQIPGASPLVAHSEGREYSD